ncbi:MAG: IS110 family transposase, partial [Gammaproteobacteria bacterium]
LPPCTVALEACSSAHYWGRELEKLGHRVRLIPPCYVKRYVQGHKNDYNDALAIAEAVSRPKLRFVSIKRVEQQDEQTLHRLKTGVTRQRTQVCNQLRGLLAEYGIVIPVGISRLRNAIPQILEDGENGLTDCFRPLLNQGYQQLLELDQHIKHYDRQLAQMVKANEAAQRLMTIPGYGPVVSSVFLSAIGDGKAFRRGRDVSAYVGLVPRQHSSGDKPVLLGISKRGNRYLRGILIHGARAVVKAAVHKDDALSRWVNDLVRRRGKNKATVALANKLARIGWAVLTSGGTYQAKLVNA